MAFLNCNTHRKINEFLLECNLLLFLMNYHYFHLDFQLIHFYLQSYYCYYLQFILLLLLLQDLIYLQAWFKIRLILLKIHHHYLHFHFLLIILLLLLIQLPIIIDLHFDYHFNRKHLPLHGLILNFLHLVHFHLLSHSNYFLLLLILFHYLIKYLLRILHYYLNPFLILLLLHLKILPFLILQCFHYHFKIIHPIRFLVFHFLDLNLHFLVFIRLRH